MHDETVKFLSLLHIELWVMRSFYVGHRPECHLRQELPRISDKKCERRYLRHSLCKRTCEWREILWSPERNCEENVRSIYISFDNVLGSHKAPPKKQTFVWADALIIQHDGEKLSCWKVLPSFSWGILFLASLGDVNVEIGGTFQE